MAQTQQAAGNAGALLQTVLGLTGAIQQQRAQDAEMVESFTRMASLAPDPTTLSRVVDTYTRLTGGRLGPDVFQSMANELAQRTENIRQRALRRGYDEAQGRGEGESIRTDLTWSELGGRNREESFFGGLRERLARLGEDTLQSTPGGFAAAGVEMLLANATGMNRGQMAESGALADFAAKYPVDMETGIRIQKDIIPGATAAGNLELGKRQLDLSREQLARQQVQWTQRLDQMAKAAEAELAAAGQLSPAQRHDYIAEMNRIQELMTVNESKLTDGQRELLQSELNYLMTVLNRDGQAKGLPLLGGPRAGRQTLVTPQGNITTWSVPGGEDFAPRDHWWPGQ